MKGLTAVIKVTGDCNLGCKYCYAEDTEKSKMKKDILDLTIQQVIDANKDSKKAHFIWHGGEPLLMGLDFYKDVVYLQNKYSDGIKIRNSIQTNGILLDDDFIRFFKENNFHIGTSLDGPEETHNKTRVLKNGEGTFKGVMNAIQKIKQYKMKPSAILILNKNNIDKIEEIYKFFNENEIDLKVNPITPAGRAKKNSDELLITSKEYGEAITKLYKLWVYDKNTKIHVSTIDDIVGALLTEKPKSCVYRGTCQREFISINPLGEVYPCGRFDGYEEFKLGNLQESKLEDIMNGTTKRKLQKREINECQPCEWKKICSSGCMHGAYEVYGDVMRKDFYCEGHKIFFNKISEDLNSLNNKIVSVR